MDTLSPYLVEHLISDRLRRAEHSRLAKQIRRANSQASAGHADLELRNAVPTRRAHVHGDGSPDPSLATDTELALAATLKS